MLMLASAAGLLACAIAGWRAELAMRADRLGWESQALNPAPRVLTLEDIAPISPAAGNEPLPGDSEPKPKPPPPWADLIKAHGAAPVASAVPPAPPIQFEAYHDHEPFMGQPGAEPVPDEDRVVEGDEDEYPRGLGRHCAGDCAPAGASLAGLRRRVADWWASTAPVDPYSAAIAAAEQATAALHTTSVVLPRQRVWIEPSPELGRHLRPSWRDVPAPEAPRYFDDEVAATEAEPQPARAAA
jgi:hypothetical protein